MILWGVNCGVVGWYVTVKTSMAAKLQRRLVAYDERLRCRGAEPLGFGRRYPNWPIGGLYVGWLCLANLYRATPPGRIGDLDGAGSYGGSN